MSEDGDWRLSLLDEEYELWKNGNKPALLSVLHFCAEECFPLPGWAADALTQIFVRASYAEINSWDDVFGKPWRGAKQRRRAQTESRSFRVWERIRSLADQGDSITNDLFDRVGIELGLSRATVSRLYYAEDKHQKNPFDSDEGRRVLDRLKSQQRT
jgi:hypothetical protein